MHHHQSTVLWHSIHSAIIHKRPVHCCHMLHTWNNTIALRRSKCRCSHTEDIYQQWSTKCNERDNSETEQFSDENRWFGYAKSWSWSCSNYKKKSQFPPQSQNSNSHQGPKCQKTSDHKWTWHFNLIFPKMQLYKYALCQKFGSVQHSAK